ncbi:MAG: ECF transporter S component [bacterium]|nr:ECF transporter S component [bacterium]
MKRHHKITRAALLTATCVVLGYLFLPVPNLEMITAGIFFSGILMGPLYGSIIGCVAETIYSTFNPMGFPPPPLLIAQALSMTLTGFCGGLIASKITTIRYFSSGSWYYHFFLGALGAFLTTIFDLLTNLSFPISAGFSAEQTRLTLILGIPFAAMHITTNAMIFAMIIPIFLNRIKSWSVS